MSIIVLYFRHNTSVLSFYMDIVLTLSIQYNHSLFQRISHYDSLLSITGTPMVWMSCHKVNTRNMPKSVHQNMLLISSHMFQYKGGCSRTDCIKSMWLIKHHHFNDDCVSSGTVLGYWCNLYCHWLRSRVLRQQIEKRPICNNIQSCNRKCQDYVYIKWEYWSTM